METLETQTPVRASLLNSRLEEMSAREKILDSLRALDLSQRELSHICEIELGYSRAETRQLMIDLGLILTVSQIRSSDPAVKERIENLKNWRALQARAEGVPAYRILTNRALLILAVDGAKSDEDLLKVPGIGGKTVSAYGEALLRLVWEAKPGLFMHS